MAHSINNAISLRSAHQVLGAVFFFKQNLSVLSLTPFLDLRLAYNSGVAFSLFADPSRGIHIPLAIVIFAFIVLLVCALFYGAYRRFSAQMMCVLSLFIGGALGNFWDRMAHGQVVDFISLHLGSYYWPTFNVADICISLGFLFSLFSSRHMSRISS